MPTFSGLDIEYALKNSSEVWMSLCKPKYHFLYWPSPETSSVGGGWEALKHPGANPVEAAE